MSLTIKMRQKLSH